MIPWNPDAQRVFDQHCEEQRAALLAAGADPDEVFGDWRALLETRAVAAGETEVQAARVQTELAKLAEALGAFAASRQEASVPSAASARPAWRVWFRRGVTLLLWLLGVALPLGVLAFELIAGFCAELLFDPMPTWLHTLLIALVPAANAWALWAAAGRCQPRPALRILNGMAVGIAAFYALQFAVITPFAAIAILYFGIGLVPLAPLLALWAAIVLRFRLLRLPAESRTQFPGLWRTALPAFLLLLVLTVPRLAIIRYTPDIESPDRAVQIRAVRILRAVGDRDQLLRQCYRPLESFDLFAMLVGHPFWLGGANGISRDTAQAAYYRVTGTPYNAVPPPRVKGFRGQDLLNADWFDPALGSDRVAARIKNLALVQSRLDGRVDAASGIAYMEWTLEFRNTSPVQREARALIELPPGGVVSRVTLWINDEPREAAFGGRSQTRQAYQQVAVQQRRDPVLVTTAGPDRVLVQCFPVPVDGTMKTRIGITAPLTVLAATGAEAMLRLPALVEQNFGVAANVQTTVWLESDVPPASASAGLSSSVGEDNVTIRGKLAADSSIGAAHLTLPMAIPYPPRVAKDERLPDGQAILQTLALPETTPELPAALALVVDGSALMKPRAATIQALLAAIPLETRLYCVVAGDDATATEGLPATRSLRFVGGCDNGPALALAAEWAATHDYAPILWLHAAQPLQSTELEALRQALDFSRGKLLIHSVQFGPGVDLITEKTADLRVIRPLPVVETTATAILAALRGPGVAWQRTLVANADVPADAAEGSSHIVRLWAADEIGRFSAPYRKGGTADAVKMARAFQLVTPVSGAVVLETAAQYAAHDLTPADDTTTPGIVPEPGTLGLLLLGGSALWAMRRRTRR